MGKGMTQKHINERFCWNITSPTRKIWNKLQPASGFPTIRPPLPHDMYLLEVDPSNSSNLRELSTEGSFTHTTSKKKPQLRYWNFEHLLAIQMKIKNLQIFLGQKRQKLEETLDCLGETQHFRNYNFVQEVAFPQWMWFRKPVLCFATVKLSTCGKICDVCQTMCFLRSLILLVFWSSYPFKMGKASPRKKQNELTAIRDSPLKNAFEKRTFPLGKADFRASCNKHHAWIQGFSLCLIGPFPAKAQEGTTCCRWQWFITMPMLGRKIVKHIIYNPF